VSEEVLVTKQPVLSAPMEIVTALAQFRNNDYVLCGMSGISYVEFIAYGGSAEVHKVQVHRYYKLIPTLDEI
jgi:hypothetical protein